MMSPFKRQDRDMTLPHFESLEERMLLTTLHGGEFLVYLNSQGEAVRVSLSVGQGESATDAEIELFAFDEHWGNVTDLVGLRDGMPNDTVDWDNGQGSTAPIVEIDDNGKYSWIEYNADEGKRGAQTEIYAIYVAKSTANTYITISTLSSAAIPENNIAAWYNNVSTWSSTTTPVLGYYDGGTIKSPTGSGGVVVGSKRIADDSDGKIQYLTVNTDKLENVGRVIGVFPGGEIAAGITFASSEDFQSTGLKVGSNVQSIAVDDNGRIFMVNLGLNGSLVNIEDDGIIGEDVNSLASDNNGTFYAVDNTTAGRYISDSLGTNVSALAVNSTTGVFYAVDEATHRLVSWDPATGTVTSIGLLVGSGSIPTQFRYDGISSLTYDPTTGVLYGIAKQITDLLPNSAPAVPEKNGPFLITINTSTGRVGSYVLITDSATEKKEGDFASIAISDAGLCYAVKNVTGGDYLYQIDLTSGAATTIGCLTTSSVTGIAGFGGLEFIGETLYGVAGSAVYILDALNPQTIQNGDKPFTYVTCTSVGAPGFGNGMTSLTYDTANPGVFYTTVLNNGGYRIARVPVLASMLSSVSTAPDSNGVATYIGALVDSAHDDWVWRDIFAMDYNSSNGLMYAIASPYPIDPVSVQAHPFDYLDISGKYGTRQLVTIDMTTGKVTAIAEVTGATSDMQSMVFNSTGTLYGVDVTSNLYTIDIATGACNLVTTLDVMGVVGLEFVTIGANEVLFGVTSSELYTFNLATGEGTRLSDTGMTTLTSLSYDASQPTALWSTSYSGGFRLTQINLYSLLLEAEHVEDPLTQEVVTRGSVIDSVQPAYIYVGIHALDFDSNGVLYGVGSILCLDPSVPAPTEGLYLITIDTVTGAATRVVDTPLSVDDLSSICYDATTGTWYGVVPEHGDPMDPGYLAGDMLVTVNMTTGEITPVNPSHPEKSIFKVAGEAITGVVGLDFEDGVLYATTAKSLYSVSKVNANCKLVREMAPALTGEMSSLAGDSTRPYTFWTTEKVGDMYYLMLKQDLPSIDMGRIIVAGTVAGQIQSDGNIGVIEMGFMWGQIDVTQNVDTIIMRSGGGALYVNADYGYLSPGHYDGTITASMSRITVGGTLGGVYTRSGTLYTAIQTEGDTTIDYPSSNLQELEVRVSASAHDYWWLEGDLVDFNNDTWETAQYLSHPTGDFTLEGGMGTYDSGVDWYGMSLLAGQTVTIDGSVINCVLKLYDSHMNYVGSYGYETEEDEGIRSRGYTRKPLTFTALEAGVYYVVLEQTGAGSSYALNFANGTAASLGAVSVVGGYGNKTGEWEHTAFTGTGDATNSNISAKLGGNIGAISITGISYSTVAYALAGGDLIAFQAGQMGQLDGSTYFGENTILSDSNIGEVMSITGQMDATIIAGNNNGFYNHDAFIQNVYSTGDYIYANDISATGSIGVIEVKGNMANSFGGVNISINSDDTNTAPDAGSTLDLLDVVGDFYALGTIYHGPNSNIGYVHVGGDIYINNGSYIVPVNPTKYDDVTRPLYIIKLNPTTYSDGVARTINDDSGGKLKITPTKEPVLDADGKQTYDVDGNAIYFTPTYSYCYIPVDDFRGGVGGVIANLTIDGSATFSATGLVEISDLALNGANSNITLNGSGMSNIYYAHGVQLTSLTTNGSIVSGSFTGITTLNVKGNIGSELGDTGAWVYGWEDAPAVADTTTQPQYGWFHGKINGLNISGSIGTLNVAGSLQDLRVVGTIGTVIVDSDGVTATADWDGVNGIVWSGTRLNYINVGDGLADDGGVAIAQAAIMSTKSIGEVRIDGPYYVENGIEYGLINGAIIGHENDVITTQTTKKDGTIVTTYTNVDAITKVTGTNGARLTGLVLACDLDDFRAYEAVTFTGGITEVNFSGADKSGVKSWINGAEVSGLYVRKVVAGKGSNGIANSYITGEIAVENKYTIGEVYAAGAGMYRVFLAANGGSIGTVKTTDTIGDIYYSSFVSTNGMTSISTRNMISSGIHMPGKVGTIAIANDMYDSTLKVGSVGTFTVKGNFEANSISIATELSSLTIGGSFINSYLAAYGAATGYLKAVTVTGNISGAIESAGKIGSIISKTGLISADISTLANDWSGDIALIQTALGYTGKLEVANNLTKFVSYASLGDNPAITGEPTQIFNIVGNLDTLKVVGDLFAGINVGGNIGTVDVDGTFYSSMYVNGNIKTFIVDGGLGGILGGLGARGILTVLGTISSLKFNTSSDLVADLTVGGTIASIALTGGDIIGNIKSNYGSINAITLNGGSITGDIEAASIGKITVKGGNITGDITASNGGITSITLVGSLDGDISATNGRIASLNVTGNILAGNTIEADGGIGTMIVKNGSLFADVLSGRDIASLTVQNGNIDGAMIDAETAIGKLIVKGGLVNNSTVRSGGTITTIDVAAATGSIFSSAWNIGTAKIAGAMTNSYLLAGYDIGHDGIIGGGDDALHSGDISSLTIGGAFDTSIVAAGIDPHDGNFWSLGDNTDIPGVSSISKVSIKGAILGGSMIMADTYIDPKAPVGAVVAPKNTPIAAVGTDFGPEVGTKTLVIGGLTLTLTGAGLGTYDALTNTLYLNRTTVASALTLANTGANITINIAGSEDSQLSSLKTVGAVTLGDVSIYGNVKTLVAAAVADGSTWELLGGSSSATLGNLSNVNMTTGQLGTLKTGSFTGGSLTVDAAKSIYAGGSVTGDISAILGNTSITVVGNMSGDIDSYNSIGTLNVVGSLSGNVTVTNGDLLTTKVAGNLTSNVNVENGIGNNTAITGALTGSFRASSGIGSFTTGAFSGLLSTDGNIKSLTTKGVMSGKARAGGSINAATFASMNEAIVSAGNDFLTAKVTGDMTSSQLFAGFDTGDAGQAFNEDDNLAIDAFYPPVSPLQIDSVRGGTIKTVTIGGFMTNSTISAAVGPGADGYCGTDDDVVAGTGYITTVKVTGAIYGNITSCGVFAASNLPTVYQWAKRPFVSNGTAHVDTMKTSAGPLTVTDVAIGYNSVTIYFNHPVNASTIGTEYLGMVPGTLTLLLSDDGDFGSIETVNVTADVAHTLVFNTADNSVTMKLSGGMTWETLSSSDTVHYQLTLDGDLITDKRSIKLDGDYTGTFPSGDGEPGTDFVYEFTIGEKVLADVPAYEWWYGCAPTAAGMLIGYYDNTLDGEFIVGDANSQAANPNINEMIASSGDGQYVCDRTGHVSITVPGTAGTGHIPDYAIYNGYDDSASVTPYSDLSTLNPGLAHADNCIADFMLTSRSNEGLKMGGSWPTDIGTGLADYVEYVSQGMTTQYTATTTDMVWGMFTWDTLVNEINAGRPILLGVDSQGSGVADHAIIAVGYNEVTNQYACYSTWEVDNPATAENEALEWYDFAGVGSEFGISMAILVEIEAA